MHIDFTILPEQTNVMVSDTPIQTNDILWYWTESQMSKNILKCIKRCCKCPEYVDNNKKSHDANRKWYANAESSYATRMIYYIDPKSPGWHNEIW